jgi:hypothetical protein
MLCFQFQKSLLDFISEKHARKYNTADFNQTRCYKFDSERKTSRLVFNYFKELFEKQLLNDLDFGG